MTRLRTLIALVAALTAFAAWGAGSAAADPVCEDTPYGQVCEDLETEDCNVPECQAPGVHAWPDPIGQTLQCADALAGPGTTCDQVVVTVRVPGATAVTTVPTPDGGGVVWPVNTWLCDEYHVGPKCPRWPPD